MNGLGDKIKECRINLKITQEQAAAKLQIKQLLK